MTETPGQTPEVKQQEYTPEQIAEINKQVERLIEPVEALVKELDTGDATQSSPEAETATPDAFKSMAAEVNAELNSFSSPETESAEFAAARAVPLLKDFLEGNPGNIEEAVAIRTFQAANRKDAANLKESLGEDNYNTLKQKADAAAESTEGTATATEDTESIVGAPTRREDNRGNAELSDSEAAKLAAAERQPGKLKRFGRFLKDTFAPKFDESDSGWIRAKKLAAWGTGGVLGFVAANAIGAIDFAPIPFGVGMAAQIAARKALFLGFGAAAKYICNKSYLQNERILKLQIQSADDGSEQQKAWQAELRRMELDKKGYIQNAMAGFATGYTLNTANAIAGAFGVDVLGSAANALHSATETLTDYATETASDIAAAGSEVARGASEGLGTLADNLEGASQHLGASDKLLAGATAEAVGDTGQLPEPPTSLDNPYDASSGGPTATAPVAEGPAPEPTSPATTGGAAEATDPTATGNPRIVDNAPFESTEPTTPGGTAEATGPTTDNSLIVDDAPGVEEPASPAEPLVRYTGDTTPPTPTTEMEAASGAGVAADLEVHPVQLSELGTNSFWSTAETYTEGLNNPDGATLSLQGVLETLNPDQDIEQVLPADASLNVLSDSDMRALAEKASQIVNMPIDEIVSQGDETFLPLKMFHVKQPITPTQLSAMIKALH
jgi:hypothetical protein